MAVTNERSDQFDLLDAVPPSNIHVTDWRGKLRFEFFTHTQVATGDANSTVELVKLPAGKVRVFKTLSVISVSALGAARTMDVGYRAHTKVDGTAVAEVEDAFISALDVSAATNNTAFTEAAATTPTLALESREGITIFAKVEAAAIDPGETFTGVVFYAID